MINRRFPIVAQKTKNYCSLRMLAVNTYNLQQHHFNSCSQLLFRSEFSEEFLFRLLFRPEFRRVNHRGPLLFLFYFGRKSRHHNPSGIPVESMIYQISFFLYNKFCCVCANINYSSKYVSGIFG